MKVLGYAITPDIELAVIERMKRTTFTSANIIAEINRRVPGDMEPCFEICCRAADRLIQRFRQSGSIEIVSRNPVIWKWTAN